MREAEALRWIARVEVTIKREVLDPQGVAVENSLNTLGYDQVSKVRIGKYIELKLEADDRNQAEKLTVEMAEKVLSNPVIEDFTYKIEESD